MRYMYSILLTAMIGFLSNVAAALPAQDPVDPSENSAVEGTVVSEERWSDADGDRLSHINGMVSLGSAGIQSFLNRAAGEEARLRESGDTQSADALVAKIATANDVYDPEMLADLDALDTMSLKDRLAIVGDNLKKSIELGEQGNEAADNILLVQMEIFCNTAYRRGLLGIVPDVPASDDDEGGEASSAPAHS